MDSYNANTRIVVVIVFAFLFLCLVIFKLYQTQIVEGKGHRISVEQTITNTPQIAPKRGSIFFTNNEGRKVLSAVSKDGYLLGLNTKKIKEADYDSLYNTINGIVALDRDVFDHRISSNKGFVILKHNIKKEEGDALIDKNLKGLELRDNRIREYPWGTLAAHVLGFSREAENKPKGEYGIEKYWDHTLASEAQETQIAGFADVLLDGTEEIKLQYPPDIVTTIDPWIQLLLEKELEALKEKYNGEKVGGVILNPKTGKVYAMGALPNFNPNEYSREENFSVFLNPIVEEIYEFGSIMKPLTVAAALDSKAINSNFKYTDYEGSVKIDDFTIHNFDKKGRGANIDLQSILSNSLNTGIHAIVKTIGINNVKTYLQKLELGKETGIDLPNETRGKISNVLESPRLVESVTAGYGQGVALTPIAMAKALTALANDGKLANPYIVSSIIINGEEKTNGRIGIPQKEVFSKEIANEVTDLLITVVDEALVGGVEKREHYTVAAKTGTGLLVDKETKKYYEDKFLHSFFGYFPATDPEFLILLYIVDPKDVKYASQTLTTPFSNMVDSIIDYHNIKPDR